MPDRNFLDCWAITAPGLEPLAARELEGLGIAPGEQEPGGVGFRADRRGLYAANLHLRTASRVLVRAAEFHASEFYQLEKRARRVPWEEFVPKGGEVTFRVTSRKSRLYHQRAVEERLLQAVAERVPGVRSGSAGDEEEAADEAPGASQLFVVRLLHDRCTISADSSGPLLHRRGYRLASAKAPMRETLAAGMLLAAGWDGSTPLLDPFCGSGTIPIEAALLARRVPPGLGRADAGEFAFRRWPAFDAAAWDELVSRARAEMLEHAPAPIVGSDRDAGAVEAAAANAARAGVARDVELRRHSVSGIEPPPGPGAVITNPPYGVRVGERQALRNLFAQFGHVLRRKCPGWRVALLSARPDLERQTALALEPLLETSNGGIRVRLVGGRVPDAAAP